MLHKRIRLNKMSLSQQKIKKKEYWINVNNVVEYDMRKEKVEEIKENYILRNKYFFLVVAGHIFRFAE